MLFWQLQFLVFSGDYFLAGSGKQLRRTLNVYYSYRQCRFVTNKLNTKKIKRKQPSFVVMSNKKHPSNIQFVSYNYYWACFYRSLSLTDALHGSVQKLSILFCVEIDKRFHAASVWLKRQKNKVLIWPSINTLIEIHTDKTKDGYYIEQ